MEGTNQEREWQVAAESASGPADAGRLPAGPGEGGQSQPTAAQLAEAEAELASLEAAESKLRRRQRASEAMLERQRNELQWIRGSVGWLVLERLRRWERAWLPAETVRGRLWSALQKKLEAIVPARGGAIRATQDYERWMAAHEPSWGERKRMKRAAQQFPYRPLISIVVPVYKTPGDILRAAIDSVRRQIYENWQLCLADDGSNDPQLSQLLAECARADGRIVFKTLYQNQGIAGATNEALGLARGEFIGFLDHDDELSPDALYWVVKLLNEHREADLMYSDEDKLNAAGRRCDPFFKPDWSPDLLLSCNYACHFLVVRRSLLEAAGGLRRGFEGAQDWDLELRLAERSTRIYHIPRVLYHWRAIANSTACGPQAKPQAAQAQQRAINEHLERTGARGTAEPGCAEGFWNVRYEISEHPQVAVIVAAREKPEAARRCCESILAATQYPHFEVVIADGCQSAELRNFAEQKPARIRYAQGCKAGLPVSALHDLAAEQSGAPLVLFLDESLRAEEEEWLTALAEQGQRAAAGAVGAKLLYPNGTIEHAGVLTSLLRKPGHAFRHVPAQARYYFCFPQIIRNCNAVSGACLLTKRGLFLELGKFASSGLPYQYAAIDYCMRVRKAGLRIVYTPLAELTFQEMKGAAATADAGAVERLRARWGPMLAEDPYYSPHLTTETENYRLKQGPGKAEGGFGGGRAERRAG